MNETFGFIGLHINGNQDLKHAIESLNDILEKEDMGKIRYSEVIEKDGFYIYKNYILIPMNIDPVKLREISYKAGKYVYNTLMDKYQVPENEVYTHFYIDKLLPESRLAIRLSRYNHRDFINPNEMPNEIIYGDERDLLMKLMGELKRIVNTPHNYVNMSVLINYIVFLMSNNLPVDKTHTVYSNAKVLNIEGYNLLYTVNGKRDTGGIIYSKYRPENSKLKIALVGKGVHFDTGGYSLKPSDAMITMKRDKTGAITALMIYLMIAMLELPIEVDLVLGFAENMLSEFGYKPGDVLTSKNGKTIEVINTDAEGRLVLADCLEYLGNNTDVDMFDHIFTIATLTGAAMRAVSKYTIAEHGDKFIEDPYKVYMETGELYSHLEAHPKLEKHLKSKIADIKNVADTTEAGSITAYLFLKEFVPKNTKKYTHLDIAGPSYTEKQFGYTEYGATGCLLESFHYLLKEMVK